jgi:hypothetical protein
MKRGHALLISLIVSAAAVFGTFAATHSVRVGRASATSTISSAQIAAHNRALDRTEAKLRRMLAEHPAAAKRAAAEGRQRVIYVRPAPHLVTVHHGGNEKEESEREAEGHEGGGFDD